MNTTAQNQTLNFFKCFNDLSDKNNNIIKHLQKVAIHSKQQYDYHSGGGHNHLALHLNDDRILIYHTQSNCLELSFETFKTIEEYFEYDDRGFGFENDFPNYDDRSRTDLDLELMIDFINRSLISTYTFDVQWGERQIERNTEREYLGTFLKQENGWKNEDAAQFVLLEIGQTWTSSSILTDMNITRVK